MREGVRVDRRTVLTFAKWTDQTTKQPMDRLKLFYCEDAHENSQLSPNKEATKWRSIKFIMVCVHPYIRFVLASNCTRFRVNVAERSFGVSDPISFIVTSLPSRKRVLKCFGHDLLLSATSRFEQSAFTYPSVHYLCFVSSPYLVIFLFTSRVNFYVFGKKIHSTSNLCHTLYDHLSVHRVISLIDELLLGKTVKNTMLY